MEFSNSHDRQVEDNIFKIIEISRKVERMSKSVLDTTTMLTTQEQNLLYLIAKEYFTGEGAIFDGGCCTGGCAQSFAKGLSERNLPEQTAIYAYELGEVTEFLKDFIKQHYNLEYNVGSNFIDLTRRNLSNCTGSEYIKLFEGDITEQEYPEKIEILFLDVCKIPEVNHSMVQLLERCLPGKTLIVQQDFKWAQTPWINISMGYLEEYLYPIECDIFNTQVFLLTKAVPKKILQRDTWYDSSLEEKLRYFSRTYQYIDIRYRFVFDQDRIPILEHHGLYEEAAVQSDYLNTFISLNPLPEGWNFTPPIFYSTKSVRRSINELFEQNPFQNIFEQGDYNQQQHEDFLELPKENKLQEELSKENELQEELQKELQKEKNRMFETYLKYKLLKYRILSKITFGNKWKKYKYKKKEIKNILKSELR